MKLIQHSQLQKKQLRQLPNKWGNPSGYLIVALVEDNSDMYVAFTNLQKDNLWIEKCIHPTLITKKFLSFEDLAKIKDDEEWTTVRNFLAKSKVI